MFLFAWFSVYLLEHTPIRPSVLPGHVRPEDGPPLLLSAAQPTPWGNLSSLSSDEPLLPRTPVHSLLSPPPLVVHIFEGSWPSVAGAFSENAENPRLARLLGGQQRRV